jgi:hypothetical protein
MAKVEKVVRVQLTIERRQLEWLKKKKIYSPSKVLRAALDELMVKNP